MAALMPTLQESPAFDAMAVYDDVDAFVGGIQASFGSGVVAGGTSCLVTQHGAGAMSVDVLAGSVIIGGTLYSFAGTSGLAIGAASAGDRRDTVVLRAQFGSVTATVVQGTPPVGLVGAWTRNTPVSTCLAPVKGPMSYSSAATPQASVDPNTDVVLAEVVVPFNATSILGTLSSIVNPTTGNIVDKTVDLGVLIKGQNLSDVPTKGTGRFNLRVPALASAQAAATANVNIASAPASVDGFSFVSSGLDTVLLTAQNTASQNGPWVWNGAASALSRPSDWLSGGVVTTGRTINIQNGTSNVGTQWYIAVPSAGITIDTTAQTWTRLNNPVYNLLTVTADPNPAVIGTNYRTNYAGNGNFTLPTSPPTGSWVWVKQVANNTLSIVGTVDGNASFTMVQYQSYLFVYNGTNWDIN
jgi:hypothetical protein